MIFEFLKAYIFNRRSGALVRTIGWISLLGVSISVIAMIVVVSVMTGFGAGIRERLLAVEPHLVVTASPPLGPIVDQLRANVLVSSAEILESQDVMIRTVDGLYSGANAKGINSTSLKAMLEDLEAQRYSKQSHLSQREFDPETFMLRKGEVVLGVDLAHSLMIFPGDEIVVISPEALLLPLGEAPRYERVRVKGLIRSNVPQIDSSALYYGRGETLKHVFYNVKPEPTIELRLKDPMEYPKLQKELAGLGYQSMSWVDRNSALFFSLKIEKFLMTLFLTLTFLIGSFSIVTLIFLLSTQKRKDMGILQAMGLARSGVQRLFAGIGILLATVGMGAGLVLGLLTCWWIDSSSALRLPDIYYDTRLPVKVDYFTISIVLGIVFFAAVISAWWTARQSTNISPVEGLRAKN